MESALNGRMFTAGSFGLAASLALPSAPGASAQTSDVGRSVLNLSSLLLTLTDLGFEIEPSFKAGRYQITVKNTGSATVSHFAGGKLPEGVTNAEYEDWLKSDGDTDALKFDDIGFIGVPDWSLPDESFSGVVDFAPGTYFVFDPTTGREPATFTVEGTYDGGEEPPSDVTVVLHEMAIDVPDTAFTTMPLRWKIENRGGMIHECAVAPVPSDLTDQDLKRMIELPFDATPAADLPQLVYQPVAAIGLIAKQHISWIDVQIKPGRYLIACMAPINTYYPHAYHGMFRFFDVLTIARKDMHSA